MPNVHTPERQPDETQKQYRSRRKSSAFVVKLMRSGPKQQPFVPKVNSNGKLEPVPMGHYWLGQHENAGKNQHRKAVKAAGGIRQYNRTLKAMRRSIAQREQVAANDPGVSQLAA